MSLVGRKSFLLISIWISGTLLFATISTTLGPSQMLFGLPWIVYLAIIAQISIFFLFLVILKTVWRLDDKEGAT